MAVKRQDIKDLLIEELENKKSFSAKWDTNCDLCGDDIFEGDEFYFFGDKKKIDSKCFMEIQEEVSNL
jgi:hypothetical protein